jgi:hypothetical protein
MIDEEAKKLLKIIENVDGGCSYCIGDVLYEFYKQFPEVMWEKLAEQMGNNLEYNFDYIWKEVLKKDKAL